MTDNLSIMLDSFIDENKDNIKNDLSRLVAIPSIASSAEGRYVYGIQCAHAIDEMAEIGTSLGLKAKNYDYHCLTLTGEQSGTGEKEVGIICHLDVVPAGEGWEYEPFKLTEKDGLYIGRGTRDDKGGAITALYAMKFLKENDVTLPFSVKLILGSDEEVAMTDLPYYLSKHKPPFFSFTPDSEYPVCIGEKGIAGVEIDLCRSGDAICDINGGHADNAVCDSVNAVIHTDQLMPNAKNITIEHRKDNVYRLSSLGLTSHAAYPEGSVNAIYNLAHYVNVNSLIPKAYREHNAFHFLEDSLGTFRGEGFGIECSDKESGYLTCISGRIYVRDDRLILNINIRYPVTKNFADIMERLK
ncbi:MAG TPA: Sapep family Mn(2+)-dependent dipeptidase, partial [Bacillota bacterium]|nr:Sapep family Mn(2+)-dependent dipeptidase [Bacillota bacterium]